MSDNKLICPVCKEEFYDTECYFAHLEKHPKNKLESNVKPLESPTFLKELQSLINEYSMENYSNTPDFILATYLMKCLENFDQTTRAREKWYGKELKIGMDNE